MTQLQDVLDQLVILGYLMVLIFTLLLWILFRSGSALVWPLVTIALSVSWCWGITVLMGTQLTSMIGLTILLIFSVGIADCVHVMSSYLFFRRDGKEHDEALSKAYGKTGVPILLTTITTMAGMSSLAATGMPMFVQFGLSSAAGVFFAFLYTIYLLPVLLNYWHPMQIKKSSNEDTYNKKGIRVLVLLLKSKILSFLCFFAKPLLSASKKVGLTWLVTVSYTHLTLPTKA